MLQTSHQCWLTLYTTLDIFITMNYAHTVFPKVNIDKIGKQSWINITLESRRVTQLTHKPRSTYYYNIHVGVVVLCIVLYSIDYFRSWWLYPSKHMWFSVYWRCGYPPLTPRSEANTRILYIQVQLLPIRVPNAKTDRTLCMHSCLSTCWCVTNRNLFLNFLTSKYFMRPKH